MGYVLTGNLVTLRPIEPDDYPTLSAYANDVALRLLVGGTPPVPAPRASVAALYERRREDPDEVNFAITTNDPAGKLIGQCGLFRHDHVAHTAEVGVTIGDSAYWGRGYGREVVSLLAAYAFQVRNLRKLHLAVLATNERAIRAYAAAGFAEEGRRRQHVWNDGAYTDLVLMGRFRDERP